MSAGRNAGAGNLTGHPDVGEMVGEQAADGASELADRIKRRREAPVDVELLQITTVAQTKYHVGMSTAGRTPKDVLEYAKKHDVKQLDLRFTDLPGLQQHISYPISQLKEDTFEEGFGIDGSSIRGWAAINESDMLLIPDPATAVIDPFYETKTLVMVCDVIDPITRQHYDRDPRWIAQKAELYLKNSGIADTAYFGAEAEFFIFDNVRFDQNAHSGYYFIDAEEGRWNSGREYDQEKNLGYRPRFKEGYFPVPPTDHYQDLRAEMVETMIKVGLDIECHHHEVATAGQLVN